MINDLNEGTRDRRGDWTPNAKVQYPPVPWQPAQFFRWLLGYPGYFLPYGAAYALLTAGLWFYATPDLTSMRNFSIDWVGFIFLRNFALVSAVYGCWHYLLYVKRIQGSAFKLNGRWPSTANDAFLFKRQNTDNMIWALVCGVPIWTAYEVVAYWTFANGYVPWINFSEHPVYFLLLIFATPVLRDVHFYFVHRLLHWAPLYKLAHTVHHNNVNPGPWSGLAMHPIEHILYFSGIFLHLVIPSHPFHAAFHGLVSALGPARGHAGFETLVVGGVAVPVKCNQHYLHHKYFECNYGDGLVPFDKWMDTFHDGSPESLAKMEARFKRKAAKSAATGQSR